MFLVNFYFISVIYMVKLVKGSIEAKEHMQKLREMRGGSVKSDYIRNIIYKEGTFQPSLMQKTKKSDFILNSKFSDKDHTIVHLNKPMLEKQRDDATNYIDEFKYIDKRKKENREQLKQHQDKRDDANKKIYERDSIIHARKNKVKKAAVKKGKIDVNHDFF